MRHYYREIIRYWNKLNFVFRKTLRVAHILPKANEKISIKLQAIFLYATYRVMWEHASSKKILNEIASFIQHISEVNISPFLRKLHTFDWEIALQNKSLEERLSLQDAVPTFVVNRLLPVMSAEFLDQNLQFMNAMRERDDTTLRINMEVEPPSTKFQELQAQLSEIPIPLKQDPHLSELFHVPLTKKAVIIQTKWYQSGDIIFQDKGSALIIKILAPKPDDIIIDMCAAPGVKTSLIAQQTQNSAVILASDIHHQRISAMKKLLSQLKTFNIFPIEADGFTLPIRADQQFDRVLLDAPCTGSGTFAAEPILKWRQNLKFLQQNRWLQQKLLSAALGLLKSKGIIVYSTCSLYPEEGELQIIKHLDSLRPLKLPDWLSPSYSIEGKRVSGAARLFPAIHNTQGFFISKFQKVNS